jgi:signal transduction histidine kinase
VTLRRRLAFTLVATAALAVALLAAARRELMLRSEAHFLRDFVLGRAASLGRERCESGTEDFFAPRAGPPPEWRGRGGPVGPWEPRWLPGGPGLAPDHGPGFRERWSGASPGGPPRRGMLEAFVYDDAFRAADVRAPEFPPVLRAALERGADSASRRLAVDDRGEGIEVAVRTGWSGGRCAIILARRNELHREPYHEYLWSVLPVLGALLASVLAAAGPVVRRIRLLTADVRRAAETRYEQPVRVTGNDEVTELARAFNDAGARVRAHVATLEERNRTLREFLANTTHDVMIPLTVLQGHLSSLRERLESRGPLREEEIVPALQEAQYLGALLHNLGAAAKLEAGEPLVERHPVDLSALVERVVARHRPVAGPADIAIEFGVPERPVMASGDVTLIEQAVSNVVHNAVRYNRAGGHVAVLLEEEPSARFRLRVLDDGPGVAEDELARLVERRRRGNDARQRHPGGLGLGLHIACTVAERHGFDLRLGRSEHGGLEVTLAGPTLA